MVVEPGLSGRVLLLRCVTAVAARRLDVDESTKPLPTAHDDTLGFGTCRHLI